MSKQQGGLFEVLLHLWVYLLIETQKITRAGFSVELGDYTECTKTTPYDNRALDFFMLLYGMPSKALNKLLSLVASNVEAPPSLRRVVWPLHILAISLSHDVQAHATPTRHAIGHRWDQFLSGRTPPVHRHPRTTIFRLCLRVTVRQGSRRIVRNTLVSLLDHYTTSHTRKSQTRSTM